MAELVGWAPRDGVEEHESGSLIAGMAELVDAHDSKSCIARCESSILSPGTC